MADSPEPIPSAASDSEGRKPDRDWILYRCSDAKGELLYVGMSGAGIKRFFRHAEEKEWWGDVAHIDLEHFPSEVEVRRAERKAIRLEKPSRNIKAPDHGELEVAQFRRKCRGCRKPYILTHDRARKSWCEECFNAWESERAERRQRERAAR